VTTATVFAERGHAQAHEPLAYRVNDFCHVIGLSRSKVYELISEGRLPTIKVGSRRLIPHHAAKKLIEEATAAPDRRLNPLSRKGD
jgi:excisionase family DNA binding protein